MEKMHKDTSTMLGENPALDCTSIARIQGKKKKTIPYIILAGRREGTLAFMGQFSVFFF
jgi:hypothetical protein